ncbi:hypothetical protein BD779DRAFT_1437108 [Infundibulicybe gibba]|nr:hypothetical protein BD779DRAFT_1437108 [Infundibulicybe gibba]
MPRNQRSTEDTKTFNDPDADVILRTTKGGAEFHVRKAFLSYASPFFKTMFSLPQTDNSQEMKDGKPIISVDDEEESLETVLRYCYPRWDWREPSFDSLDDVIAALWIATKYEMDGVASRLQSVLVEPRFVEHEPLRVFALAVQHGFRSEARHAAKMTLRIPLLGRKYIPELEYITAGTLHRLQEYHMKCIEAAGMVVKNMTWLRKDSYTWFECHECRGGQHSNMVITISGGQRKWVLSRWWSDYITRVTDIVSSCPSGNMVTASELVDEALAKASICPTCRSRAFKEMREFTRILRTR